jgi:ribose-phosphate pyrophosphokinase
MSYTDPLQIGILACPAGEVFAGEIISHLTKISKQELNRRVSKLARDTDVCPEELIERANFYRNITEPFSETSVAADQYPEGNFKIDARFTRFANGEFKTEILKSVRGMDVFVVQDVSNQYPVPFDSPNERLSLSLNDHIFCLLVTVDAALQAGARRVTLVLPTYPYARQHRKRTREGLTASRFGQIMEYMGVERIITLDIHCREIENTFNHLRLENLHASYQIVKVLKELVDLKSPDLMIVSPDTGAVDRNKFYAQSLKSPLGLLYKERDYSKLSVDAEDCNITNTQLLGSVKEKTVFMGDDILGTGGTILMAMKALKKLGARKTICAVSLPLFNGNAVGVFDEAYREGHFHRIIGTNAVYHDETLLAREWYVSANVSALFAESIFRLHHNRSVSTLLDNRNIIEDLLKKHN